MQPEQTPQQQGNHHPQQPGQSANGYEHGNWQRPVQEHHQHPYTQTYNNQAPVPHIPPQQAQAAGKRQMIDGVALSHGEVLIAEVRRHPIGVLKIYFVATIALLALLFGSGALVRYVKNAPTEGIAGGSAFPFPPELITWLAFALALFTILIATVAIKVYNGNRLFLTNESVIQRLQASLFHTKEQTISLGNIEDASFEQGGIIQHLFGYGTVRLSTEGEETTYYFRYATNPKAQVGRIIEAQEVFNQVHPEYHNSR